MFYTILTYPVFILYRITISLFGCSWNTKITNQLYLSGAYIIRKDKEFLFKNDIDTIINLATEIYLSKKIRYGLNYYKFKIKDGGIPTLEQINEIYNIIDKELKNNSNIQINCAFGAGRSVLIVIYYLVKSGKFKNINEALNYIKKKRPQIGLNKKQLEFLYSNLESN